MPFEVPVKTFDAVEHAKNKVLRANQLEETILQQFKSSYEDFWGVSGSEKKETVDGVETTTFVGGGSRYTVEEMQSILNTMGATAIQILTAAAGLTQFIEAAYSGALPDHYKTAAFEYEVGQNGLTLTKLADAWAVPVEENQDPV
jgi:hypothetical protein